MGAVVTSLKSKVTRRFVPMTAAEKLRKLVENDFIVGKTVREAEDEYPEIRVRVIGWRSASGEVTTIPIQLTHCGDRVDHNGVIFQIFQIS